MATLTGASENSKKKIPSIKMNKFDTKIKAIFTVKSSYGIYNADYVNAHTSEIGINEDIDSTIREFDLIITLLSDFYMNITSINNSGDFIELGRLLLIREYIKDIRAIRELTFCQLENQLIAAARNFMERSLVVILSLLDDEYCNELFLNSKGYDENKRYFKLFKPASLVSRIESNPNNVLFTRGDTWDETYSLFSKFTHSDVLTWLKYYDEGKKYNISLWSKPSQYFKYRVQYIIQYILFSFPSIMYKYKDIGNNKDICDFMLAYLDATIDMDYK